MRSAAQDLVATNYHVRAGAYLYSFVVIGVVLLERGAGPLAWTLLLLQFIVYPHLVYWRARSSSRPVQAELNNLYMDAVLLAAWCAELGFPTWITFSLVASTSRNAVVKRGAEGFVVSLACSAAGAGRARRHRGPRLRGPPADPAPRRGARRAARERGALPADRGERR